MSFAGKVALITGASKGIGRAIALRLGRDGASVAVGYGTDAEGAQEVVEHIGHERARAFQADVAVIADLERLVKQTVEAFGKIDVLIPAAGVMAASPLEATSEELFDRIFAINVKHPMFLCQVCSGSRVDSMSDCRICSRATESGSSYGCRIAYCPHLDYLDCSLNRDAPIPSLCLVKGSYRADDSRAL